MANFQKRVPENVPGDFFVDTTCIDCDTCRQLAPQIFGETDEFSFVRQQPVTNEQRRQALRALVACPTGSIGDQADDDRREVLADFPLLIEEPVYYCGFTSPKSFGGSSYFVRHPDGNWLIDSPKFLPQLVKKFHDWGGIANIFLTHEDDVADAARYAAEFGSRRIIHREELSSQPDAELVLEGFEPQELAPGIVVIPTPGHTEGHLCLLFNNRFLFTGDHLAWNRHSQRLIAFKNHCWYSWPELVKSMHRLKEYRFDWVLPGHGERVHLPAEEMRQAMTELLESFR